MFEEYLKHLRDEPISHRLTVKTKCGTRAVILLTTERIDRAAPIPCRQAAPANPGANDGTTANGPGVCNDLDQAPDDGRGVR